MSDSKSLLEMVSSMQKCSEESSFLSSQTQPMVIIDAGIATKDNVKLLREEGFSYLVNETRQNRSKYKKYFNEEELFTPVKKDDKELTVKIRHLDLCDGEVESKENQVQVNSGSINTMVDKALLLAFDFQEGDHNHAPTQAGDEKKP